MGNELVPAGTISGLPIPSQEKVARWLTNGAVIALGVAGVNYVMPYINKALGLLVSGVWSVFELGIATAVTFAAVFAIIHLVPVYRRCVEMLANKLTWAIIEYDPITPYKLWLDEMRGDLAVLYSEHQKVSGIIGQNASMIESKLSAAKEGDKRFAYAVGKYGPDSKQAREASIGPSMLRDAAERIRDLTEPLSTTQSILGEVMEALDLEVKKAAMELDNLRSEFAAAEGVKEANEAAGRALHGRSDRKRDAIFAADSIHRRLAVQFGRVRGLRQISSELLSSVDLDRGTYHQEALARLREASQEIKSVGSQGSITYQQVRPIPGVSFFGKTSERGPLYVGYVDDKNTISHEN